MIIVVVSRSNKATNSSRTIAKSQTIRFESSYLNPCVMTLVPQQALLEHESD
jgi:hypothetical protein